MIADKSSRYLMKRCKCIKGVMDAVGLGFPANRLLLQNMPCPSERACHAVPTCQCVLHPVFTIALKRKGVA
jgi:hypothetical protein